MTQSTGCTSSIGSAENSALTPSDEASATEATPYSGGLEQWHTGIADRAVLN